MFLLFRSGEIMVTSKDGLRLDNIPTNNIVLNVEVMRLFLLFLYKSILHLLLNIKIISCSPSLTIIVVIYFLFFYISICSPSLISFSHYYAFLSFCFFSVSICSLCFFFLLLYPSYYYIFLSLFLSIS